jgi:hypothetical protein
MTDQSPRPLSYTTDGEVTVPLIDSRWGIRKDDWNRLKRNINKCNQPLSQYSRIMDIFTGIGITAFFTTITFYISKTVIDSWVYAIFIVVFIFSCIIVYLFYYVSNHENNRKNSEIKEIKLDMDEIEASLTVIISKI